MAFSHTNKIVYDYSAGGSTSSKIVSKTETAGAEINLSEQITIPADSSANITISDFEFATAAQARSVMLRSDGAAVTLYANSEGVSNLMGAALADGEPYVWSYNGGTDFPNGNSNPMIDSTASIIVKPAASDSAERTPTITIKVLYDPTP